METDNPNNKYMGFTNIRLFCKTTATGILKRITGTDVNADKRALDIILYDSAGNTPLIVKNALATTILRNRKTVDGKLFDISHVWEGVADDAIATTYIKCHADYHVYSYLEINSEGAWKVELFETPTSSGDGTGLTAINTNRDSANTLNSAIYHTPTTSADGTKLVGKIVGSSRTGGGSGRVPFWKLKKGTNYLLKLTNKSGLSNDASINIECFEEEG